MGNTWVINMKHYDYPEEDAHRVPREAVRLAAYFASIVAGTVGARIRQLHGSPLPQTTGSGSVLGSDSVGAAPRWPRAAVGVSGLRGHRGHLGMGGTRWDPARKAERYRSGEVFARQPAVNAPEPDEHETIQGTITWDEGSEDGLPKVVTAEGKEYRSAKLGQELMIHEGWRVKIELG